ncbi:MAG: hypothetical protein IKC32_03740 [Clostridia bacterium]|nr:hypothetical protein [Clostridia bacterium]
MPSSDREDILGVYADNLDKLAKDASRLCEARALEIDDVADEMAALAISMGGKELGALGIASVISEVLSLGSYPKEESVRSELRHAFIGLARSMEAVDRAHLAYSVLSSLRGRGTTLTEEDFLGEPLSGERFAYVRNQFSDEAYDVFSVDFRDPRVRYAGDFKDCVKLLTSGEVDYILLPIEERGGVRLPTVSELIYRSDLKITGVTPVWGFDSSQDMRYALISTRFRRTRLHKDDDRYLELRLSAEDSDTLEELLTVGRAFGMSVYRISTLTHMEEGEPESYFSLVLRDEGREIIPLLFYLAIYAPDVITVGVYKNLE